MMPALTDKLPETVQVLLALKAYTNGQLPPFQCAPNGPGHEKDWTERADKLLEDYENASPEREALISACEKVLGILNHGTKNSDWPHIDRIRAALFLADPVRFAAYNL